MSKLIENILDWKSVLLKRPPTEGIGKSKMICLWCDYRKKLNADDERDFRVLSKMNEILDSRWSGP